MASAIFSVVHDNRDHHFLVGDSIGLQLAKLKNDGSIVAESNFSRNMRLGYTNECYRTPLSFHFTFRFSLTKS